MTLERVDKELKELELVIEFAKDDIIWVQAERDDLEEKLSELEEEDEDD